jgi:WD40 repeat protein
MKLVHRLPAQQGSRVKCFAACANLERATVCLFDGSVTVWDLTKAEPVITLQARGVRDEAKGHTSAVNEVLMKADGGTVVTLSKDTTVRVWDVATGSCRRVLRGHTDVITGGCLSDEGNLLATHAYDHTVRLWSIDSGECVACMALDADVTHTALSRCGWRLAAAFADGRVMLCDLQHPEEGCVRVHGHTDEVTGLSFSADGLRLLSCSVDCTARVVNAATGDLQGLFVSDCGLTCCHFDSVTECVVLGTDRGVVHFVDASTPHAANVSQILPK